MSMGACQLQKTCSGKILCQLSESSVQLYRSSTHLSSLLSGVSFVLKCSRANLCDQLTHQPTMKRDATNVTSVLLGANP